MKLSSMRFGRRRRVAAAQGWPVALVTAGALALLNRAMMKGKGADAGFYDAVKRPAWSPPLAAFAPVWLVATAAQAWGDLRLLRRGRVSARLVATQAVSWAAFLAFVPVFFRWKSPRLAFASGVVQAASTAASIVLARPVDGRAALSLAPTAAWLTYAVPVSGWIAARNGDPFLRAPALR